MPIEMALVLVRHQMSAHHTPSTGVERGVRAEPPDCATIPQARKDRGRLTARNSSIRVPGMVPSHDLERGEPPIPCDCLAGRGARHG